MGADIEARDVNGNTPLHYACRAGSKEIVELLITHKADLRAVNKLSQSCMQIAQKHGADQELQMLLV